MDPTEKMCLAAFQYYPRLHKVKEHVERHLSEDISLAAAAEVAGLEQKYFSTFFHAKTGVCFKGWLTHLRVNRAIELMRSRNHPITDIAFAVGFHDLRTFERAFKKHTGKTPRAYKKSVRPG